MAEKRVLILSCNTGGGHNAAGKAVFEEFSRRGTECAFLDYLKLAGKKVSDDISDGYVGMVTKIPSLFGVLYSAAKLISSSKRKSPVYYANTLNAENLRDFLDEHNFDTLIMPHLFPAEAVTDLKKKNRCLERSVVIATDYTCIPFWEETSPDVFVLPHRDLVQEYVKAGISRDKLLPIGIPVSFQFNTHIDKLQAREMLDISPAFPCVLIMSGSMGFGNVSDLIRLLLSQYGESITCIVLGGGNARMKNSLRADFAEHNNIKVLDFTDRVGLYMDAADVLLTKPGGLTSTELAVKNIPAIFTKPIPGCETVNEDFFVSRGMGYACHTAKEQAEGIHELLFNKTSQERMLEAQRININPYAASDICDMVLEG